MYFFLSLGLMFQLTKRYYCERPLLPTKCLHLIFYGIKPQTKISFSYHNPLCFLTMAIPHTHFLPFQY